jgi:hypothetical protein
MFDFERLESFFKLNKIPLAGKMDLFPEEVESLFIAASNQDQSFGGFILLSVLNISRTGITTNFDSYDDLYEAYCAFMTGYLHLRA